MVKYNPRTWFSHIFTIPKGDTLRVLWPEILIVGLYTLVLAWFETTLPTQIQHLKGTTTVHSLIGVVLGLLLVFRTNTGYDRWWEGRRLWGAMVNVSRGFAVKLHAFIPREREDLRHYFAAMIPNYVFAMKEHLRSGTRIEDLQDVDGQLEPVPSLQHPPNYIHGLLYEKLQEMHAAGSITGEQFLILDAELRQFSDIIGACERIRNTPIPFSYSLFIKKFIFLYTITLPVGFIPDFGYTAAPIAMCVFYVLVSLEILAEEIEDPFGTEPNDLPTDELSEKIRNNVHEILLRPAR